jgi:hypothetical protein
MGLRNQGLRQGNKRQRNEGKAIFETIPLPFIPLPSLGHENFLLAVAWLIMGGWSDMFGFSFQS